VFLREPMMTGPGSLTFRPRTAGFVGPVRSRGLSWSRFFVVRQDQGMRRCSVITMKCPCRELNGLIVGL